jgi:DNA repair protein RadC
MTEEPRTAATAGGTQAGAATALLPAAERPRERLLARGPDALSDHELLALLLRTGDRGRPVLTLAAELLASGGGLGALLDLEATELAALRGVGPARAALLKAALALAERHARCRLVRAEALTSPAHTARYLKLRLRRREREVFAVLLLDSQHRVIEYEELFFGTIDGTSVHPREVVRAALRRNAAAVIVAHNHPSGVAEPSQADVRITERLRSALALVDVRLLDHFVVGDVDVTSLAERGLI